MSIADDPKFYIKENLRFLENAISDDRKLKKMHPIYNSQIKYRNFLKNGGS